MSWLIEPKEKNKTENNANVNPDVVNFQKFINAQNSKTHFDFDRIMDDSSIGSLLNPSNKATKRKKEEPLTRFVNRVNPNQGVYIVHLEFFVHFLELFTQKDAFLRNLSLCWSQLQHISFPLFKFPSCIFIYIYSPPAAIPQD